MPSKIWPGHGRQVSLYQAARKKPYKLLYVTEKKWDFKSLAPEEYELHLKKLAWYAHSIRRVLSVFSCPFEISRLFVPDYDHFYWKSDAAKTAAAEIWQ